VYDQNKKYYTIIIVAVGAHVAAVQILIIVEIVDKETILAAANEGNNQSSICLR